MSFCMHVIPLKFSAIFANCDVDVTFKMCRMAGSGRSCLDPKPGQSYGGFYAPTETGHWTR